MTAPATNATGHLRDVEMAAYLDRRLTGADRERAEAHLAECAECRQEMIAVRGHLDRSARPRRLLLGAGVLAAAAAMILVVRPAVIDPMRGGGYPEPLVAYGPSGDVAPAGLRFVWGAASGATAYRLVISGEDGVPLWSGSVTDTVLALPDSVSLAGDRAYVWVADALMKDGSSRSTSLHAFRLVR